MLRKPQVSSQRAVLAALVAGSAAALLAARPSRGQQSVPALDFTAPATAVRQQGTRVALTFALPPGLQLYDHQRVRVVDARGRVTELLPATITQLSPAGAAYRDLHSYNYPGGIYRVSVELDYRAPGGAILTVASAQRSLAVPG